MTAATETAIVEALALACEHYDVTLATMKGWHFAVCIKATDLRKVARAMDIPYLGKSSTADRVVAALQAVAAPMSAKDVAAYISA